MADENSNNLQEPEVNPSEVDGQSASTSTPSDSEYRPPSTPSQTNNLSTNMNNIDKHRHSGALRILELYGRGYTQAEIAEIMDISQATVSKEFRRIKMSIYDKPDAYAFQAYSDQERSVAGLKAVGRQL